MSEVSNFMIKTDPLRLQKVVLNLLSNAIIYTPQGGTINIKVVKRNQERIQISICDNGIGIKKADQAKIF
jgi:two-component system clock-associated histidine kinase SasA